MKLQVRIFKLGALNEPILRAIGNHNGEAEVDGKIIEISIHDIAGFVRTERAKFPSLYPNVTATIQKEGELRISDDDGNSTTLLITESFT